MNRQLPIYTFLNDLCKLAQDHKQWPIEEMDYLGSRFSGKTRAIAQFSADMCSLVDKTGAPIKVSIIIWRKDKDGEKNVFEDYCNVFNQTTLTDDNYRIYYSMNNRQILFQNGSSMKFKSIGVRKKENSSSTGAGLSACIGEYIICVFEECFEFTETEMSDIEKALRGFNPDCKLLKIKICNPYYPTLPFIKEFYNTQPLDINAMQTCGYQMGIYDSINPITGIRRKKLLLQMNWRAIQNFRAEPIYIDGKPTGYCRYIRIPNIQGPEYVLPQSKLDDLVEDYGRIDRDRAQVNDLGIPGDTSEDNIYYFFWKNVKPCEWLPHEIYYGGIDVGLGISKRSGKTTAGIVGYSRGTHLDIYDEVVYDLTVQKEMSVDLVYEAILDFYERLRNEIYEKSGKLIEYLEVRVDKLHIEFINEMNARAGYGNEVTAGRGWDWINFVPCSKYPIWDRVCIFRNWMSTDFLRCNKDRCINLDEEFTMIEWDSKSSGTTPKRINDKDHSINWVEYACEPFMYQEHTETQAERLSQVLSKVGKRKLYN